MKSRSTGLSAIVGHGIILSFAATCASAQPGTSGAPASQTPSSIPASVMMQQSGGRAYDPSVTPAGGTGAEAGSRPDRPRYGDPVHREQRVVETGVGSNRTAALITTTTINTDPYVDRLAQVYTAVAIPAPKIARLNVLDRQLFEARSVGDEAAVTNVRAEARELLTPDERTRVHKYLSSNSLSGGAQELAYPTFAPEAPSTLDYKGDAGRASESVAGTPAPGRMPGDSSSVAGTNREAGPGAGARSTPVGSSDKAPRVGDVTTDASGAGSAGTIRPGGGSTANPTPNTGTGSAGAAGSVATTPAPEPGSPALATPSTK